MRWMKRAGEAAGLGLPIAVLAIGCAGAGASYSGTARAPAVAPAGVTFSEVGPEPLEHIGQVDAACERVEAGSELDGVKLSDLGCSRELLVAALQDRAALVGGTVLVNTSCAGSERSLECGAEVWGPAEGARPGGAPVPTARLPVNVDALVAAPGLPPRGFVSDAWRVRVEAWPRRALPEPRPSLIDSVEEHAFPSMGQVAIGDVRASCAEGCNGMSVREALLPAAAHLGATSVVAIRCIQVGAGSTCVGTAAVTEFGDDRRSEAR